MPTTRRPTQRPHHPRKLCVLLALTIVVGVPVRSEAADPKVGSTCTKAKLNVVIGQVRCTKVGKKFVWRPTPPPTTTPTGSVPVATATNDPALKSALETAIGGTITYTGTCGFQYGCNAKVQFPDADPAIPSLLSIGGMPPEVFQNQLAGRELVVIQNAGFNAWLDDKRAVFFMPTRPIDKLNTHYQVRLTVTAGVPNGSPVFATRNERLLAVAKVFESFVSKSGS